MSKIHSKIDTQKSISLAIIVIILILIISQIYLNISAIISSQKNPKSSSSPIQVQQQNLQKAYDQITSQTVTLE